MSKKHQDKKVKFSPFVQQDTVVGNRVAFGRESFIFESVESYLDRGGKIMACKSKIPKIYQTRDPQ